jgi:hypothetical protein
VDLCEKNFPKSTKLGKNKKKSEKRKPLYQRGFTVLKEFRKLEDSDF